MPKRTHHLRIFGLAVLAAWVIAALLYLYFYPYLIYRNEYEKPLVNNGLGGGGIPINTLYTVTVQDFISPYASKSKLLTTGANHDTLYTAGWLDLSKGPQVLHVPDMAGRYYSVALCDPSDGAVFSNVGTRTTGTKAGDYLITGSGWQGTAPSGVTQISSPDNAVLVLGRTLVESDSDIPTAYGLAKQIQLTPLDR